MRRSLREFAAIVARTLPIQGPIFEFGSLQVPGQVEFADLRPLFPGQEYVGCDMREGPGVDRILNLHALDLPAESVGTVLCFETLEHVEYPRKAMQEIHRVLRPGGLAVITSVMNFPIHSYPCDYWRFTPEAFKSILNPFPHCFAGYQGNEKFPHTVVGLGFKGEAPPLDRFLDEYAQWQRRDKRALRQIAMKWTPPALFPAVDKIYNALVGPRRAAN